MTKILFKNLLFPVSSECIMSFQVPGLELDGYKLLLQLLGVLLIGIIILYVILSSRGDSD